MTLVLAERARAWTVSDSQAVSKMPNAAPIHDAAELLSDVTRHCPDLSAAAGTLVFLFDESPIWARTVPCYRLAGPGAAGSFVWLAA